MTSSEPFLAAAQSVFLTNDTYMRAYAGIGYCLEAQTLK